MERTWRWFGKNDKITLAMLKEIGVEGIVTALHDVPLGEVWTREKIRDLNDQLNIPQSIKDYANGGVKVDAENPQMVSEEEFLAKLPEIAANAEQDACTPENPRETKAADFEKILKACYYDTDIDF